MGLLLVIPGAKSTRGATSRHDIWHSKASQLQATDLLVWLLRLDGDLTCRRFSYCALLCCKILDRMDTINVPAAVDYVVACQNFDGGFGCTPGGALTQNTNSTR